jgi:L-threonylcarbamoyladenylate synthase
MIRSTLDELLEDSILFEQFVKTLEKGDVVVLPTDTLYGFAVHAESRSAVDKVYEIKDRDSRKPLILFLESSQALGRIGISPDSSQQKIIEEFWPGALTAIFTRPTSFAPEAFSFPTLGIRVPGHSRLLELLQRLPMPLLTTSANRSGAPSDTDPEKIAAEFANEVAWLVDDGLLAESLPSTVIDMSSQPFRILRVGAVLPKL